MQIELPEIRPAERTPLVEALLAIIQVLLDRNQQLEETILQLRDEIALLKGQKPRPQIQPSCEPTADRSCFSDKASYSLRPREPTTDRADRCRSRLFLG